jgi:glycosyltransferase involved in cell wall biosynthesis
MVSSVKLAELWQRMGYRVVVVCMGKGGSPWRRGSTVEEISATLRIYRKPDFFLRDPLNFGIAPGFGSLVRKVIAKEHPDLLICNKVLFWGSFCLPLLRARGHKILLLTDTLVGMTWQPRPVMAKIIMSIGAWTMGWLVLRSATSIVFFHPQPPRLLRLLGIEQKSRVIPTGIDPAPFLHERHRTDIARSLSAVYIGRLESVKGVDDFLAAAVPLQKIFPRFGIRVVGWYAPDHPLPRHYPTVQFTGLREDIPEILEQVDIFVLPSYSEGLSNALMEAMASGCACIATDVGGNRFLIENGMSGLLFPAGDRAALRAHLERLLRDPAKCLAMGTAAQKRIHTYFRWNIIAKQYQALFEQYLQQQPA